MISQVSKYVLTGGQKVNNFLDFSIIMKENAKSKRVLDIATMSLGENQITIVKRFKLEKTLMTELYKQMLDKKVIKLNKF